MAQLPERIKLFFKWWKERAGQGLPVAALFLITIVFFSDILQNNGLFAERDLGPYFIPPRLFWVESLSAGQFPLWNPLNFGGHPFFATLQPGMLYPPNILFLFLPFHDAFNWIIIIHFFLAGAFTYALLCFLEAGRWASFLGAVIFLLGGYLLSLHSLLSALLSVTWLPLILLLFGRSLRFNSISNAVWTGGILAISFLAGGVETVLGICAALGLMTVFARSFGGSLLFGIKALVVTGFVFAGITAIQLIPFLELSRLSIRQNGLSYQEAIIWSASLSDFVSFLVPDPYGSLTDMSKYWLRQSWLKTLYVGGLPFFLMAIYLARPKKINYFWVVLGMVSLFFAMGGFNPLYPYLYQFVPGINKIRYPVKFLFLGMFALSIMAGLGLQRVLDAVRKEEANRLQWAALVLATMAAVFFFGLHSQYDSVLTYMKTAGFDTPIYNDAIVNLHNFKRMILYVVLSCMVLWVITKTKASRYAVGALCLVVVLDLFGNFGYYGCTRPEEYFADNWTVKQVKAGLGQNRKFTTPLTSAPTATFIAPNIALWGTFQRVLAPSTNMNYGVRDMWGIEVMRVKQTHDLYQAMASSASIDATRIIDLFSVKYVISTKPISSPYLRLVGADIDGLEGDRNKLLQENTIKIYENKRVPPRTLLLGNYSVEPDPAKVLTHISSRDFDPTKSLALEELPVWDPAIPSQNSKSPAGTKILAEKNNEINVEAQVQRPSLLYLSDTYYPGWHAYVDGKKTKIYRANYNFRAVPLPPGQHRIDFRYEPMSFYVGAGISATTVFVLIAVGVKSLLRGAAQNRRDRLSMIVSRRNVIIPKHENRKRG